MDPKPLDKMRRTLSFPFASGQHKRVAMKITDFRGNEVVRVVTLVKEAVCYG